MEVIGIFVVFLGFVFFFNMMSKTLLFTSDDAAIIVEAKEFLSGNLNLHGWTVAPDSYTTTDMPFYIVGMLVRGVSPSLMHNIPAVVYALLVITSSYIASQGFSSHRKWIIRIIVAIILSLVGPWNGFVLLKGFHVTTILAVLVSLFLLQNKNKFREIVSYLIMASAIVSDPLSLFIGPFPILLAMIYHKMRKYKIENNVNYKLALKVIIATMFGITIHYLVPILGGYSYQTSSFRLPSWSELIRNLVVMIQDIPVQYGVYNPSQPFTNFTNMVERVSSHYGTYFIGHQIDLVYVGHFARLLLLVFLGYIIWKWLSNRSSFSFLDSVLVFGMFSVVGGLLIYPNMPEHRYFAPVFIYGVILMGRYVAKSNWNKRSVLITASIMILFIITWIPSFSSYYNLQNPEIFSNSIPDHEILANWLLDHNLYSGYGSYWNTYIITIYAKGKISVAPVTADGPNGTMSSYPLFSNIEWYKNDQHPPRTFLIYDNSNYTGVNKNSAIKTWGEPSSHVQIKYFTILIWDHPIIPK